MAGGGEAIATVDLDSSGYEAGSQRVAKANERMWSSTVYTEKKIQAVLAQTENVRQGSLLRGERRVAKQTAFIVGQAFQAQTASELAADAIFALGNSAKIGFGATVGLFAGFAAFTKIKDQIEAAKKAEDNFREAFNRPIGLVSKLGPEGISADIQSRTKALEELQKQRGTITAAALDALTLGFNAFHRKGVEGVFEKQARNQQQEIRAEEQIIQLAQVRGEAELKVAKAKELSAHFSEVEGQLAEITAAAEAKRAAIRLDPQQAGKGDRLNAVDIEESLAKEAASKTAFKAQSALITDAAVARFRGTEEEKITNALQAQLETANAKAKAAQTILEKEAATTDIAKAQQAIDEHRLDLAEKTARAHSSITELKILEKANDASGDVIPGRAKLIELQSRVDIAKEELREATRRAVREKFTPETQVDQKRASVNLEAAQKALHDAQVNDFFRTPQQRLQDQQDENTRASREDIFNKAGGFLDAKRDISGNIISGIDPSTGERISGSSLKDAQDALQEQQAAEEQKSQDDENIGGNVAAIADFVTQNVAVG